MSGIGYLSVQSGVLGCLVRQYLSLEMRLVNERTGQKFGRFRRYLVRVGGKSGRGRTLLSPISKTLPHSSASSLGLKPRTNKCHNLLDVIPTKLRASAYKSATLCPELILCHSLFQLLYLGECNIAEGQPLRGFGRSKSYDFRRCRSSRRCQPIQ